MRVCADKVETTREGRRRGGAFGKEQQKLGETEQIYGEKSDDAREKE